MATAVLDRDLDSAETNTTTELLLPVSMIENLRLDPQVIWTAISVVHHKTDLHSVEDAAINAILDELAPEEISRRIKNSVPQRTFRLHDPVDTAQEQVQAFADALLHELTAEQLGRLRTEAEATVAKLKTERKRREFFELRSN